MKGRRLAWLESERQMWHQKRSRVKCRKECTLMMNEVIM